jgi:hypothetical protein
MLRSKSNIFGNLSVLQKKKTFNKKYQQAESGKKYSHKKPKKPKKSEPKTFLKTFFLNFFLVDE